MIRSFVQLSRCRALLLYAALTLLDELLGHAGAAATGADGERLGLDEELVHRHPDVVLSGQLGEDGLEAGLFGPLESHGELSLIHI